ncbi:hypothetical protein LCGC14_1474300 [marine sediment metagenome]|uniref:Uncharacterized protein n=1 Tax=marine sediment metagenome TaxID=412755 RepID=A0A0F9MD45_9ZZZZ
MRNLYPKGPIPKKKELSPAFIEVWHHESGLAATHNFPCPVCKTNTAILFMNDGQFYPCDQCSSKGWHTVKLNRFWRWALRIAGVLS